MSTTTTDDQVEKHEGFLVFKGTWKDQKKKTRYDYRLVTRDADGQYQTVKETSFNDSLHGKHGQPGQMVRLKFVQNDDRSLTVYGPYELVGQWPDQGEVIAWQSAERARQLEEKVKKAIQAEATQDMLQRSLDPVRRALKGLPKHQRQVLLAWVVDYLLS